MAGHIYHISNADSRVRISAFNFRTFPKGNHKLLHKHPLCSSFLERFELKQKDYQSFYLEINQKKLSIKTNKNQVTSLLNSAQMKIVKQKHLFWVTLLCLILFSSSVLQLLASNILLMPFGFPESTSRTMPPTPHL